MNQCGLFQVALAAVTQGGDQNDRPAHAQAAQTTRQMQTLELKSACCDGAAQLAGYREEYWRLYGELRRSRASLGGLGSRIAMHPALILALKTTGARRSRCGPCSPTRPHAKAGILIKGPSLARFRANRTVRDSLEYVGAKLKATLVSLPGCSHATHQPALSRRPRW